MEWIPWTIGGVGVAATIIIAVTRNGRLIHTAIHKRIDKTRDDCKDITSNKVDKEVFIDFRKETRGRFDKLDKKVDEIPEKVKRLLNGG
ncbi:hypothetical protein LCGC14_1974830 [marine sediment metagenome]|uniref:Uncharacterized protein n=1 Tax=marine sediment metagenome TaxID=412755 RepID=A0A0F9FB12_9ZZZZ